MTSVCYLFSALAHVHMLVKMHNVLYIQYASTGSPRYVVEKRGSQWMSPTLGNLCALRCWFVLKVCYEGSSDVLVARADDVDPFPFLASRCWDLRTKPRSATPVFLFLSPDGLLLSALNTVS
jgi:hypothetical protein